MTYIVTTKEQLEKAQKDKIQSFIVEGELAKKLKTSQATTGLSKFVLAALVASIVAIPTTGGLSAVGAGAIATGAVGFAAAPATTTLAVGGTSVTMGVVYAVIAVGGITVVLGLFKDYNVEYSIHPTKGLTAKFTKK